MTESSDLVVLGRVVGAHALRGQVRVRVLGDGPSQLLSADTVHLRADPPGETAKAYTVSKTGTGRAGEVRLALKGVNDRSAAEALRGVLVLGDMRNLPTLGDDEFYWHQVVGCDVVSEDGEPIGRVREIWETGAHDVLAVDGEDGRQILLPTAREIMTEVDLEARRVVIRLVPGLLDPDA